MIKEPDRKPTLKLVEDNTGEALEAKGTGKGLLNRTGHTEDGSKTQQWELRITKLPHGRGKSPQDRRKSRGFSPEGGFTSRAHRANCLPNAVRHTEQQPPDSGCCYPVASPLYSCTPRMPAVGTTSYPVCIFWGCTFGVKLRSLLKHPATSHAPRG